MWYHVHTSLLLMTSIFIKSLVRVVCLESCLLDVINAGLLGVLLVMSARTPRSGDSFRLVPRCSLGHLKLMVGDVPTGSWTGTLVGRERLLLLNPLEDLQHTPQLLKPVLAF
jgi:hypothetical protein